MRKQARSYGSQPPNRSSPRLSDFVQLFPGHNTRPPQQKRGSFFAREILFWAVWWFFDAWYRMTTRPAGGTPALQ